MTEKICLDIRLAIRGEGDFLNAYLAPMGTMEGAYLVGSISRGFAEKDLRLYAQWKELMASMLATIVKEVTGEYAEMTDQKVPTHEKAGNA